MKNLGKYEIVSILGKGAMGIVYKAFDPVISRQVAIKTIRFDLATDPSGTTNHEEVMQRFMREAQAAGKLSHANIITIYDVGREKDLTYIVMQLIEGPSLQRMIASGEKFSTPEIISIMTQICIALDYAHQHGIVHRDMKPGNILLDKDKKPYICDFGVARVDTSTLTQSGTAVGTPSYMSPEQVMGKKIDKRSDIFSLGCILYEILTGRRPFEAESITTVIYKIINEEPPSLTEVKKGLPMGFERIICKALAKDVNERYPNCVQLAADLRNLDQLSEKTIAITMTKEAPRPAEEEKKKPKVGLILGITIPVFLAIAAAGAFVLHQQTGMFPFLSGLAEKITGEKADLAPQVTPPPQSLPAIPRPIEEKLDKVKESFERSDFAESIRLAREILSEDAGDILARDYLDRASAALKAQEQPPDKTQEKPQEKPAVEPKKTPSLPQPKPGEIPSLQETLDKLAASFNDKNYEDAKRLAAGILAVDSGNAVALDYLERVEKKIEEAAFIARTLQAGIRSYENGNYAQCKTEMDRILKLDRDNREAKRYWNLADTAIYETNTKEEIMEIVERHRRAEENKDLPSFLMDIGSPGLRTQKQEEAMLLFNNYDEIKSLVSGVSVSFQDRQLATVEFSSLVTALNKNTGKRMSFEKITVWTVEKQQNTWKIIKEEKK